MATFQRRGKVWRAIVRKKGLAPKAKSFPTKAMAETWATRIEREYAERQAKGETEAAGWTLKDCIEWYEKNAGPFGRSKASDLARLKGYEIALERAADLGVREYVRHAERRKAGGAGPATVGNDLIWFRQVLKSARVEGVPANLQLLDDAAHALRVRKLIAKPKQRSRRVTDDELKALRNHFASRDERADIPMVDILDFALVSARRQEEITRLRWADLREATKTAVLRDVKHPRHKTGNDREFRMLDEAWAIIRRQPRVADEVFPFSPKSIGTAFTRATRLLGIADLRMHDVRHEATSRLFERGYSIQEVAQFTLHESWATLKRYTHLKPADVPEKAAK
mgnify:CR=1 FL=1